MERVKGIEPSTSAWKAGVLPLNYTRIEIGLNDRRFYRQESLYKLTSDLSTLTGRIIIFVILVKM